MVDDPDRGKRAQRLRHMRKRAGLSQYELADRTGFDRGYISMVELGKTGISIKRAQIWATACSSTVGELFATGAEREDYLEVLRELDDDQWLMITTIVDVLPLLGGGFSRFLRDFVILQAEREGVIMNEEYEEDDDPDSSNGSVESEPLQ